MTGENENSKKGRGKIAWEVCNSDFYGISTGVVMYIKREHLVICRRYEDEWNLYVNFSYECTVHIRWKKVK